MASPLRCSDADREATADRLRIAATEGRLDADELEERLDHAYRARWCHDLDAIVADVTPPPAPPAQRPPAPVFVREERSVNGLAVASVLAGALWLGWFGSILALVCGYAAIRQIDRSGGRQGGRGLAIGGLALGYVGLAVLVFTMLVATGL